MFTIDKNEYSLVDDKLFSDCEILKQVACELGFLLILWQDTAGIFL